MSHVPGLPLNIKQLATVYRTKAASNTHTHAHTHNYTHAHTLTFKICTL